MFKIKKKIKIFPRGCIDRWIYKFLFHLPDFLVIDLNIFEFNTIIQYIIKKYFTFNIIFLTLKFIDIWLKHNLFQKRVKSEKLVV